MRRRRRNKRHDEGTDESWLLPYADMLTLLLAVFIVLYAVGMVDSQKYQQLIISFNETFQGKMQIDVSDGLVDPAQSEATHATRQEQQDLKKLQDEIDAYIKENQLSFNLATKLTEDGLLLTILDDALFYSGSADVRTDAGQLAKKIAELLITDPPRKIVVAGHTDNVPISTAQFESNWDLSSQRALNFMKILLEHEKSNPRNFSATGYGEYHPVATNETEEGREKNRRVEVHILPNVPQ
ncbi:flagellar motor protein MotB [bacterium LRH843]|nr:flagellar motor protein MotB [bacterium LRH843]